MHGFVAKYCMPSSTVSTKIICVCLQRNGADFCVFVNTANEFDGSDSGARPDEAVSWGKIKMDASPVKVCTAVMCAILEKVLQIFTVFFYVL